MKTAKYSVWVELPDGEDTPSEWFSNMHKAMSKLPGFVDSSFEDSYDD